MLKFKIILTGWLSFVAITVGSDVPQDVLSPNNIYACKDLSDVQKNQFPEFVLTELNSGKYEKIEFINGKIGEQSTWYTLMGARKEVSGDIIAYGPYFTSNGDGTNKKYAKEKFMLVMSF